MKLHWGKLGFQWVYGKKRSLWERNVPFFLTYKTAIFSAVGCWILKEDDDDKSSKLLPLLLSWHLPDKTENELNECNCVQLKGAKLNFLVLERIKKRLNYLLIMKEYITEEKLNYKGTVMARKKTLINQLKWCFGNWSSNYDLLRQHFHCLKIHTAFNTLPTLLHVIVRSQAT